MARVFVVCGCGAFRVCDGQRKTSQLASTRDAHAPCQRSLVTRTISSKIEAGCTVGSTPITLEVTFLTGKAVCSCAGRGRSATAFLRGSRGFRLSCLLRLHRWAAVRLRHVEGLLTRGFDLARNYVSFILVGISH